MLIGKSNLGQQILSRYGGWKKSLEPIKNLLRQILEGLETGKSEAGDLEWHFHLEYGYDKRWKCPVGQMEGNAQRSAYQGKFGFSTALRHLQSSSSYLSSQ